MRIRQAISGFDMRIVVLAAAVCAALSAQPAFADMRQTTASAVAGEQIRLGSYMHFGAATCEAKSIPRIVLRGKPTKGTLSIAKDMAILRNAHSERGKQCIGSSIPAAIVHYTPFQNSTGTETLVYDVVYPDSCVKCRNAQVQATVTISPPAESQQATPHSPGSSDSLGSMSAPSRTGSAQKAQDM